MVTKTNPFIPNIYSSVNKFNAPIPFPPRRVPATLYASLDPSQFFAKETYTEAAFSGIVRLTSVVRGGEAERHERGGVHATGGASERLRGAGSVAGRGREDPAGGWGRHENLPRRPGGAPG